MAVGVPRLLVVADRDYAVSEQHWRAVLGEVGRAVRGRPCAIQVRAKSASRDELERLAGYARDAVPPGVPLFLNGPAEVARALGYDGVHWPQKDIPLRDDGALPQLVQSAAVHDIESLRRAETASVAFVIFGSVYEPGSKVGPAAGLDALRELVRESRTPALAIGGVTQERVAECIAAGAAGVAVVSGVTGARSPGAAANAYLDRLEREA